MKIVHVGDMHVRDDRIDGEHGHLVVLERVVHSTFEAQPSLYVLCGDLTGRSVPHRATPRERKVVLDALRLMAQQAPVVIVRGNHDAPDDWYWLNFVQADHPIVYVEEPELLQPTPDVAILALPWLDRAQYPHDASWSERVRQDYLSAIDQFRADVRALARERKPVYVVTHAAFVGAMLRDGQPTVPTSDPVLDVAEILAAERFTALLAGHYHTGQRIERERAWYAGSIFADEFGEEPRSYLVHDSEHPEVPRKVPVDQPVKVRVELDVERSVLGTCAPVEGHPLRVGMPFVRAPEAFGNRVSPISVKLVARYPEVGRARHDAAIDGLVRELRPLVANVVLDVHVDRSDVPRDEAVKVARQTSTIDKVTSWARAHRPGIDDVVVAKMRKIFAEIERTADV